MNARTILLFLVAGTAMAQRRQGGYDYRAAAATVEDLVMQKDFDGALELVQSALNRCPEDAAGRTCRAHIAFTYGYVFASRGDQESLRKAAQYYEIVLKEDPRNPQAYVGLADVSRRRGQLTDAAKYFQAAADASPKDDAKAPLLLAAAEARREAKEYGAAVDYYRSALDAGAVSAAPRLVSLLRAWGDSDTRLVFGIANDLRKRGALSAASDAYEIVIARHRDSLASEALVAWTEARAAAGTLDADALANLPPTEEWSSRFLRALNRTVRGGTWAFSWSEMDTQLARYTAVAAAKAVADTLVERGEQRKALELLSAAVEPAPMPIEQEHIAELSWRPVIYLDVALQMARLATALKDEERFRRIESSLFHEKATAYQEKNAAAIQRMHTVLGTIYTERGEWKPKPGNGYTNATFQLSAALRIAAEREKQEGTVQPLPHLHEWLARSYREQNDLERARREELDAARDYLDLDALSQANASIARAVSESAPPDETINKTADALRKIVAYRTAIPTLQSTASVAPPDWSAAGLDGRFVERQKFKTYADLAGRAQTLGESAKAEELSVRAFDAGANQKLTSTDDALRAIRVQRVIEQKPPSKEQTTGTVDYKTQQVAPETLEVSPEVKEKYATVSPVLTKAKTRAATEKKDQ